MKICSNCKQPIENGKLFCGYCGGLGVEMDEEHPVSLEVDVGAETNESTQVGSKPKKEKTAKKKKLVDIEKWRNASSTNRKLDDTHFSSTKDLIIVLLNIAFFVVVLAIFLPTIIKLVNSKYLSDEIELKYLLVQTKAQQMLVIIFVGEIIFKLVEVPYEKTYVLISKAKFIKKELAKEQKLGEEVESYQKCLRRLDSAKEYDDASAIVLAKNQAQLRTEIALRIVKFCVKIAFTVVLFLFLCQIVNSLQLMGTPSNALKIILGEARFWIMAILFIVDLIIPCYKDEKIVKKELERLSVKKGN